MNLIFLITIALLLSSCSNEPNIVDYNKPYSFKGPNSLYIVSHGWHTGFIIPVAQIIEHIPELSERFNQTPYIELGWGDKGFYQAKEITTGLTLQAIFWPTESVIHAVAVPAEVEEYFGDSEVKLLCLSDNELLSLLKFVVGSFAKDQQGKVISLKSGIYGDSQFYQGTGSYYLMNTCNKWTAKGLKSFGMNIDPLFKLTASSVMGSIQENKGFVTSQNCTNA